MKNNTPKLMLLLAALSLAACKGVNSPTTADSTILYTGPLPKAAQPAAKDSTAADSIKMGPDNFTAKDTANRNARNRKAASAE